MFPRSLVAKSTVIVPVPARSSSTVSVAGPAFSPTVMLLFTYDNSGSGSGAIVPLDGNALLVNGPSAYPALSVKRALTLTLLPSSAAVSV